MEQETNEIIRYKFVFVVDGDVGMCILVNPHEDQLKQATCLRNNPEIVEVQPDEGDLIKFNFVNNDIVNYSIDFPNTPAYERFIACLRSNPIIIEVSPSNPVRSGWKYNGTDFYLE